MEIKDARCTNCGASLKVESQKTLTECDYCHSTIMVSDAVELALVEVDKTKEIKSYRENLQKAIAQNSVAEIKRLSELLRDIVPDDFSANYFYGYALASLGDVKFLRAFYESPKPGTDDAIHDVVDHLFTRSDLRDKSRIMAFLNQVAPDQISAYEKMHAERLQVEDLYAPVPKDVFLCFSSFDRAVAEKTVKTLEADGYTCWISTRNLRPDDAENYWKNIKTAIHNARTVLVVSSQHAMISKDVQEEIETAQKAKKPIFEYKIDATPHTVLFKHVFNGIKWVDGTEAPLKHIDKLPTRVFDELKRAPEIKKIVEYKDIAPRRHRIRKSMIPIIIIVLLGVSGIVFGMSGAFSPESYTIEFIDYDGVSIDTEVLNEGRTITYPGAPEREGYTFTGWSREPETATQNATIQAEYTLNTHTVNYVDDQGQIIETQTLDYGDRFNPPSAPAKEGYEFTGWNPEPQDVTRDLTVEAEYAVLRFRVRFNDHTGASLKEVFVNYGEGANSPEIRREGYEFMGWSANFSNVTENLVVNPMYEVQTYTVTFKDYDGTILKTETVAYENAATAPINPQRGGFNFSGWNQEYTSVDRNLEITAQYSEQAITVTYRSYDNSVIATYEVDYGASAPEPAAPERVGHTFKGWSSDIDNVRESLDVTAQYEKQAFDVVFKDYDGQIIETVRVKYEEAASLPDEPSRSGYIFTGWNGEIESITEATEITARYVTDDRVTVSFETYGGAALDPLFVNPGEPFDGPVAITRAGYTFSGWYARTTGSEGTGNRWDFSRNTAGSEMTLYAKWEPNSYTINFDSNGGSNLSALTYTYGTRVTLSAPSRSGFTFGGWYLDDDFKTLVDINDLPLETLTLHAKWVAEPRDVIFNPRNGASTQTVVVETGDTLNLSEPTREGYSFDGWYTSEDNGQTLDDQWNARLDRVNEDVVLYAKWSINQYTLTIQTHNDTVTITQNYDTSLSAPSNPVREGYTFTGWSEDIPSRMPAENLTITAEYQINQYQYILRDANGSVLFNQTYNYGTDIKDIDLPEPTKTGHTFTRWNASLPARTMPARDVSAAAIYSVNSYTITINTHDEVITLTQDYGSSIEAPNDPVRPGYTFTGWSQDIPETMPARNLTINAEYSNNQYTYILRDDNGNILFSESYNYGDDLSDVEFPSPSKEGHTFDGWSARLPGSTMPARNVSASAQYTANTYTITFETHDDTITRTHTYGEQISPPAIDSREGYVFQGWYTDSSLTTQWNSNSPIESNLTLYTKWGTGVTITFLDQDGTVIHEEEFTPGETVNVSNFAVPTVENYEFTGWDKEIPTKMPSENVTLTAEYEFDNPFTFSKLTGTILGYDITEGRDVVIPSTIDGVEVTAIGDKAFQSLGIDSVVIPDSVTSIGSSAFKNNYLENVTIPNSVRTMGQEAFSNNRLKTVQLSNRLTEIPTNAFYNNQITSINLHEGITVIYYSAFYNNQLQSIEIPRSTGRIYSSAFYGNELTEVILNDGLKTIYTDAFRGNKLQSLTLPAQVSSIRNGAFGGNTELTSVTVEGDQGRFNDSWLSIGLPIELLPDDED